MAMGEIVANLWQSDELDVNHVNKYGDTALLRESMNG
jgi:hypothetical protein